MTQWWSRCILTREANSLADIVAKIRCWPQYLKLLHNLHQNTVCIVKYIHIYIYYSAWANQRRRMRSYTPRSGDRREYIAESVVYISTAREYIAESGVYIWQFITAAQRNGIFFVLQWNGQFPPVLTIAYRKATASTIEPPYSVLAQQPKRRTNFPGYSCSDTVLTWCVEPCMAGQTLLLPGS